MANYFAQTSNGNITSSNMWNTSANGSGTAVTLTLDANGVTGFYGVAGDASAVLIANNKGTIVVDANVAALEFRNDTTGGATGGGGFSLNNNITINGNVFGGLSTFCVQVSDNNSATVNGNITGGLGTASWGIRMNTSGSLVVNGNLSVPAGFNTNSAIYIIGTGTVTVNASTITGPTINAGGVPAAIVCISTATVNINNAVLSGASAQGIRMTAGNLNATNVTINNGGIDWSSAGTANISGNVISITALGVCLTASAGTVNLTGNLSNPAGVNGAVNINTTATFNLNGNIIGGNGHVLFISNNTNITINGNVTGGSGSASNGINMAGTGSLLINGSVSGSAGHPSNSAGVSVTSTPTSVVINGDVTGGTGSAGLSNISIGTNIIINGTAIGGSGAPGVYLTSTGSVSVTRARGNHFGNGSVGLTSQPGVQSISTGFCLVSGIEYGDLGQSPTAGPVFLMPSSGNTALFYRPGLSKKTLIATDSTVNVFPNVSDVRSGVVFASGNSVGTMAVPSPVNVASGVAVDNTVGTAFLDANDLASIWNVPVSGISVSNSIGERLKNCSTVATMGQQLASVLSNID